MADASETVKRALREFEQQEAADPHSADRGLLDEGKDALLQLLASGEPLRVEVVRDGLRLLWRKWDFEPVSRLLTRYLGQPLFDSETAWAYKNLPMRWPSAAARPRRCSRTKRSSAG